MKCESCRYKKFHSAGYWQSVAEGADDPYAYEYCSKYHWGGDPLDYDEAHKIIIDPFENCPDYNFILDKNDNSKRISI